MTIRQWIDTLKDVPNMKFGIKMANGMSCRNYLSPADFVEEYADWMEEKCTEIFPKNFEKDGIWYCLFIYG